MAKKRQALKKEKANQEKTEDKDDILFAFLATFFTIIGFIIVLIANKKSDYVKFYTKQSLVVFITIVIAGIISGMFVWIPPIGPIINTLLNLFIIALWLFSWIYALSGDKKEVPLIGHLADKFNI